MLDIPMSRMKHFIWYVEKKLCEAQCSNEAQLYIRAYYAKYPDDVGTPGGPEDLRQVSEKYKNKHTLFFMPLFYNDERHELIPFDPDFVVSPCNIPDRISDGTNDSGRKAWLLQAFRGEEDGSNHGGLHPPPYDTSSLTFPPR